MKIGVLGSALRMQAWKEIATPDVPFSELQDNKSHQEFDIFFDLDLDLNPARIKDYATNTHTLFMLSAVNIQLQSLLHCHEIRPSGQKFIGFNAIPGFLQREALEYCDPFKCMDRQKISTCTQWKAYEEVQSRVGMVTPRIVFMIINEAYFTLQEGTADKSSIDTAMKLGTNYPKGPFEWAATAGLDNVFNTLRAVYEDTKDERYKICPLLKTEYYDL
jgi:3-hydroxybutyryl-CoA dehydrogenase